MLLGENRGTQTPLLRLPTQERFTIRNEKGKKKEKKRKRNKLHRGFLLLWLTRLALQEATRERVPLQWAVTQMNLGVAVAGLGRSARGGDAAS
jgi:hypothetical protein